MTPVARILTHHNAVTVHVNDGTRQYIDEHGNEIEPGAYLITVDGEPTHATGRLADALEYAREVADHLRNN